VKSPPPPDDLEAGIGVLEGLAARAERDALRERLREIVPDYVPLDPADAAAGSSEESEVAVP
jgi:hypothetical protein